MPSSSILRRTCNSSSARPRPACARPIALAALAVLALSASAQQPGQPSDATITLQGAVTNALTGEPLPRALVQIEGDPNTGALTGPDGRYAIPAIPPGPQVIQVRKPGFLDVPVSQGQLVVDPIVGPAHTVWVSAQMPDVNFALTPAAAIQGQVSLSTGDPAEGIVVNLARRTIQDGRGHWQLAATQKTNTEGSYRFAGLAAGSYALYTNPAMDSNPATTLIEAGHGPAVESAGYASVFYADARQPSGLSPIVLHPGDQFQADLTLALEPFHSVVATAVLPSAFQSASAAANYSAALLDSAGHQLPYAASYDAATHTVQALLPDGFYTLQLSGVSSGSVAPPNAHLLGAVDFSVAGHAVSGLRIPVALQQPSSVELSLLNEQAAPNSSGQTSVLLSPASGWLDDVLLIGYAHGSASGPMKTVYAQPGAYWAHVHPQPGYCESSFSAGGADLAREPLRIGPSGSAPPMQLTLRADCASLTLQLPQSLALPAPGGERFYTIYVVPAFDTATDAEPVTLRPSTASSVTLRGLTPGDYLVYTFDQPVRLEYRNPEVLSELPIAAQPVTLSPGASADLVLEVPQP